VHAPVAPSAAYVPAAHWTQAPPVSPYPAKQADGAISPTLLLEVLAAVPVQVLTAAVS